MLVVIDTRVQAYQSLATGVCSGAKVIIIEQDGDAIAQITAALSENPSDSLHIVCHGEPGTLYLGKTPIDWSNLEQYRHQLQQWHVKDILLYACNIAADLSSSFIHRLHQLTGANIAASAQRVGNAKLGGSWQLERRIGNIASNLAFLPEVCSAYPGVFNDPIINISAGNASSESGSINGTFNITLNSPTNVPITVNFNTNGSSANIPVDYTFDLAASTNITAITSTSFTIAAGVTNATLAVKPVDDAVIETSGETVQINLEPGTSYRLGYGNSKAQFATATNLTTGIQPYSIAAKDFNNDSKLDLAVTNNGSGTVSVLLGTGTGSFGSPVNFPGGGEVVAGDFNSDRNFDLAMAFYDGTISILLGTGKGSFGSPTNYKAGDGPADIAVGDFNDDNKQDLVVGNALFLGKVSNIVSVLLGNGDGSFSSPTNFTAGSNPANVVVGDINSDGKQDLITNSSILLGNGDGSFSPPTESSERYGYVGAVEDFNSDGKLDLATAKYKSISVLLGTGTGSFGSSTEFSTGSNQPVQVVAGDFNGDSKQDIATANWIPSKTVSVLLGNGDGSFGTPTDFTVGTAPRQIAVGDFNGDDKPDLAIANTFSDNVSVLLNNNLPTATLTIADNDPVGVQFSQAAYQVNESGTVVGAAVTINRTGDTGSSASVQIQLNNGTATGGSQPFATGTDFDNGIQTINFASGETSKTLTIPINDDTLLEGDETLTLTLVNPSGNLTIGGQNAATLTIAANDTNNPPTVGNLNQSGNEDTDIIFIASDFTSKFTDTNGDNLTKIQVTSLPSNGILKLSDANVTENQEIPVAELGNLRFTPNPNWNGNTSFNWNGFDGTTYALSPATVNLTVNSVNDAPFVSAAIPINQTAAVNSLYNFTFAADTFSDVDSSDILTYSATPGNSNPLPNWLSFNPITRTFVGIPTNSDVGKMSVLIKATDAANASTFASFNLTVTNPAPDCFCESIIRPNPDNLPGVDTTPNPVDAIQLGSDDDDILMGTDADDSFNGLGGNDWIFGKAGKDNLIGDTGDDIIFGGQDRDYILGNSGSDLLSGNKGDDYIHGNTGNDIIWAGQGNDFARGGKDDDLVFGDKGDDVLTGDKGNDIVYGGDGRDLVFGGSENDVLTGNSGDDTLFADDGNDTVYGGKNDDIVIGDKGDDWLAGDRGNDSLCGGVGNDTAYGGSENDEICGGDGNDMLFGNQGEDTLNGELGDDTLYGGKDNDTVIGGAGNDWLHGGKGEDVFMIAVGWGGDAIADFTDGEDLLGLSGGLIFPLLAISQNNNDTTISIQSSGEVLAILTGIAANQIGQEDFI